MSLQSLYNDIVEFWKNIAPLVFAHTVTAFALIWISRKSFSNFSDHSLKFFRSATYLEWKRVLNEFELMSKIPFLLSLAALVYLAILSNLLGLLATGFSNPLSFAHSDAEFWLETNDAGLFSSFVELASYQAKTEIDVFETLRFRDQLLSEYQTKFSKEYGSNVGWVSDSHRNWSKYYQSAIVVFVFFLVVLIKSAVQRKKDINLYKLFAVLIISFLSIITARYYAEQYIEKRNTAEIYFLNSMAKRDPVMQANKMDSQNVQLIECRIYQQKAEIDPKAFQHNWISRRLDGYLPREMTAKSDHPLSQPTPCP